MGGALESNSRNYAGIVTGFRSAWRGGEKKTERRGKGKERNTKKKKGEEQRGSFLLNVTLEGFDSLR